MNTDENTQPESSPVEQVPELEDMTPAQREYWFQHGTMPQADPAPAAEPKAKAKAEGNTEGVAADPPTAETQEQYKAKTAKRIQQLLESVEAEKREAARLRGVLQGAKVPDSPNGEPAKAEETTPKERTIPLMEDYETMAEWQKALVSYIREEIADGTNKATAEQAAKAAAEQSRRELQDTFKSKVAAFEAEHPDFRGVALSKDVPINAFMGGFIMDSPKTAEILYHLGQNAEEAKRIALLPESQAARALLELEQKFSSARTVEPRKTPVNLSKAPKPTSEIAGASQAAIDEAEQALANDDYPAYERIMNQRDYAKLKG